MWKTHYLSLIHLNNYMYCVNLSRLSYYTSKIQNN